MKVKTTVLEKVNNPLSRTRIALDLRIGEQSVAKQMTMNVANGRLTKMDALMAISKEAQIDVSEILEDSENVVDSAAKV